MWLTHPNDGSVVRSKMLQAPVVMLPDEQNKIPGAFIISAPRSGSTRLRYLFDSHSDIAAPIDPMFFVFKILGLQIEGRQSCLQYSQCSRFMVSSDHAPTEGSLSSGTRPQAMRSLSPRRPESRALDTKLDFSPRFTRSSAYARSPFTPHPATFRLRGKNNFLSI